MEQIRVSEMVAVLSYALDLTEGQPIGHSAHVCLIGMRIVAEIGMPLTDRGELYYTLLINDAACSSNASRLFHIIAADEECLGALAIASSKSLTGLAGALGESRTTEKPAKVC